MELNEKQRESILQKQLSGWPLALRESKRNPYATLCFHCFGRHAPPNDDICPDSPPHFPT